MTNIKIQSTLDCRPGNLPEALELFARADSDELTLRFTNHSDIKMSDIEVTLSYFDEENLYIDFQDFLPEPVESGNSRADIYTLKCPEEAKFCTIDVTAVQQTFWRRHWKLISTVTLIAWTFILLARRWSGMGP